MARSAQTPYWCFTLKDPGERRVPFDRKVVQYVCYQLEDCASKTCHYRGFIQFMDKKSTLKKAKRWLGEDYRLEAMNGRDPVDVIRCVRKDEGRLDGPWEFGEFVPGGSNKRKRAIGEEKDGEQDVRIADAIRNWVSGVEARKRTEWAEKDRSGQLDRMDRPWQTELRKELEQCPARGRIHWVYGPVGGEGKTTFVRALVESGWECLVATPGMVKRSRSMRYGFMGKHVVIDIPRCVCRQRYPVVYQVIEEVKQWAAGLAEDELWRKLAQDNVHVVVMCNRLPDYECLSGERICLHDLSC